MDGVLLEILHGEPGTAATAFESLLTRTAPHRVLRFLDERPHVLDLVAVAAGMPKAPVARASARRLQRAFTHRPVTVG
jgi:hypothetical protein